MCTPVAVPVVLVVLRPPGFELVLAPVVRDAGAPVEGIGTTLESAAVSVAADPG